MRIEILFVSFLLKLLKCSSFITPTPNILFEKRSIYHNHADLTLYSTSDFADTGSSASVASSDAKKRVYQPRVENSWVGQSKRSTPYSKEPKAGGAVPENGQEFYNKKEIAVSLSKPQLLIRFKFPREISDLKKQLLEVQEEYKAQSADRFYSSGYDSSSRGVTFNDPKFSFGVGQDMRNDKKPRSKTAGSKDEERRMGRPKSTKDKNDVDSDDDYSDDYVDSIDRLSGIDDDYVSLSTLSGDALREMESEGLSLEEIQLAVFGEYGIKASISAIKKRMSDDKNDRKFKKRTGKTRRDRAKAKTSVARMERSNTITLPASTSIQILELASLIGVGGGEVVKYLMMNLGMMVSMNQNVEMGLAKQIIEAFGKQIASGNQSDESADDDDDEEEEDTPTDDSKATPLVRRPPVVTIMGHVDHGKTTLLDRIRKIYSANNNKGDPSAVDNYSAIAPTEAGGITQSINAFKVKADNDQFITFIDTPGHSAFSEMRKRGANVTDIVVLVVAADEGIKDQTIECIFAAKAAGCPIVVAINKVDKEGADPQSVLTELTKYDVLAEDFGGDVQFAKLSAKKGVGIEDLLDKILLQADIMELKARAASKGKGTVIESKVDKRLGTVVTLLVQSGELKIGDIALVGPAWGRIRRMLSDQGADLTVAGPSTPVQLIGFQGVPNAGDELVIVDDESSARDVADARIRLTRQSLASVSTASMLSLASTFSDGVVDTREVIKIPIVLKTDVSGSLEAIKSSIESLRVSDDEAVCVVDLVFAGIGDVTSSDVAMAAVAKAKIMTFNVGAGANALDLSRSSNVEIGFYNVIYDLLDEITKKVTDTIKPPPPGVLSGTAEVKKIFKVGKSGKIAGCTVTDGIIKSDCRVRIMRGKRSTIFTGLLSSLRVGKDIVSEVGQGSDCGISFQEFTDFEEGDIVEFFAVASDQESN